MWFVLYPYLSHRTGRRISLSSSENWKITLVDTGHETLTAERIMNVRSYVEAENFLCTYGDGLANIDIKSLIDFHLSHGKIATLSSAIPRPFSAEVASARGKAAGRFAIFRCVSAVT